MVRSIIMLAVMIATLLMIVSAFGHESINDPKHNRAHNGYYGNINHAHSEGIAGGTAGPFHTHEGAYRFTDDNHTQDLSSSYLSGHDVNNPDNFTDRGDLYFDHNRHTTTNGIPNPIERTTQTVVVSTKQDHGGNIETVKELAPDTPVARTAGLGSIGGKTFCTDGIEITRVDNSNYDPYFLLVYISNKECGFTSVEIKIVDTEGDQKLYHRSGILSPRDTHPKQKYANNMIVISDEIGISDWYPDLNNKRYAQPRYFIDSRHKKFRYTKGDSIELSVGNPDDPFFTYIDDTVPASPRLNRNIATTWADMKRM